MAQELGRIERPSADQYSSKRKLLLVPLVYGPPVEEEEALAILKDYWDQVGSQVASMESTLGDVRHIYHESLAEGGDQGLEHLQRLDQRSHELVQSKCQAGATLEATEDVALLAETLDLQRCLMLPFTSEKVASRLHEWFSESVRVRYEHISQRIDATLQGTEMGLLLISERHQVQFPADVEVFYVAPPALDKFRRWLADWMARRQQPPAEAAEAEEAEGEKQEPP